MKGKPTLEEGDPTGVEKEPTGLARRDIVRRDPCSMLMLNAHDKEKELGYLDRSGAKGRVPPGGGGGGEVLQAGGESRMGERGD